MGFRKKVSKTVSKYATKRVAKRVGKKIVGKFIPGYNVYSTADDLYWAGTAAYQFLKRQQLNHVRDQLEMLDNKSRKSQSGGSSRRKRYGIDDWY